MNVISSSYYTAERHDGICRGTLWRTTAPSQDRSTDYCVLTGNQLDCYESRSAWCKGDFPVSSLVIVGASADSTDAHEIAFRLVSNQGTHLHCQATSKPCRQVWIAAFYAGLELSLETSMTTTTTETNDDNNNNNNNNSIIPPPPAPQNPPSPQIHTTRLMASLTRPPPHCRSCGSSSGNNNNHSSSNSSSSPAKTVPATPTAPLPQYGFESRVVLCHDCAMAQGLLRHLQIYQLALQTAQYERKAFLQGRDLCFRAVQQVCSGSSSNSNSNKNTTAKDDEDPQQQSTASSSPPDEESWTQVDSSASTSSSGGGGGASPSSDHQWHHVSSLPSSSSQQQSWISVPANSETTKALFQVVKHDADFGLYARQSPLLDTLRQQFLDGIINAQEFLELIRAERDHSVELAQLKQQAFRVAGDMGSALQLLLEQTKLTTTFSNTTATTTTSTTTTAAAAAATSSNNNNTDLLICVLDFLLDLCRDGETNVVAFFWPQLCHLHLRMLPPETPQQVLRVELLEDFLLTVAARYSIHLALELVWSHTADLEASLDNFCYGSIHAGSAADSSSGSSDDSAARARRFAVLRFVCELESLLFDFEGGWGGGSVSLGKMLSPTGHQVAWLQYHMRHIQALRLHHQPVRLSQSARLDMLKSSLLSSSSSGGGGQQQPPQDPATASREKLRIARNADYFSCHLIFTRRLSDIAEKLRFMEVADRPQALQDELELLNASGTMGGDPLNRVDNQSVWRVVRVPSTEGHVFRSKERTPVLLLMELVDESAQDDEEEEEDNVSEASEKESEKNPPSSQTGSALEEDETAVRHASTKGTLKRFDEQETTNEPTTPKRDVEKMVNTAAVQQLQELVLPDLKATKETAPEKDDENDDSKEEFEATPLPIVDVAAKDTTGEETEDEAKEGDENNRSGEEDQAATLPKVEAAAKDTTGEETEDAPVQEVAVEKVASLSFESQETDTIRGVASRDSTMSSDHRRSSNKRKTALGHLKATPGDAEENNNTLAPTGDIRREVLNAIMMRGIEGNAIAAGTAISVQRSLQELERKRATALLLKGENTNPPELSEQDGSLGDSNEANEKTTRESLVALGLSINNEEELVDDTEEDEVMEAIRLLLIQNRVAQGKLSPADAAKVLQHASLNRVASNSNLSHHEGEGCVDSDSEVATVDAGDVDPRLVGCGPIPPAVLQALTLWKGGLVTNAELLELVKKDAAFVRHSVLLDAENVDKLNEDSAFWGRFAFGERWAEKKSRIASSSPQGATVGWDLTGVIVKSNDDLRQEAFVMQLIELCQEAFDLAGLELWVNPYRILATGRTTGVIEMVRNAMSFDALKKRPGYGKGGLREHLQRMTEFTVDPGEAFKSAQLNFVRSLAAYSLMSYLFLFKDRHNGNILLDTAGHVIHIDFGFVFGIAPGGSFSLELSTPFKLTEEMLDVMGGLRSPLFSEFVTLFCCGFLALQSYKDTFLTIVEIMCEGSTFKCFEGKDTKEFLAGLSERFCPDKSKEETVSFALDLIKQATTSYGTRQYDIYQYLSQGIAT